MKIVVVFAAFFALSCFGIIAGYSELDRLLDTDWWPMLLADLPVFTAATIFTANLFASLLLAFWFSRGDRKKFGEEAQIISFVSPMLLVLIALPGYQSKPEYAPFNLEHTIALVCVCQMIATKCLRDWIWERGTTTQPNMKF